MRILIIAVLILLFAVPVPAQAPPGDAPENAARQAEEQDKPPQYEDEIEVVGVTPLHGLGVPRAMVPGNIQTATAGDIGRTPGGQLDDALVAGFASVHANEAQNNPFQPDIQFRGFTVSPLLGLPQGLAIYQDGVRMNEPFGDTVNWELLPSTAIASVNLMPGSNPLFGLNALGGALSIQTKTGFSHPGHSARAFVGSFGRRWADVESGGHTDRFSYFVTGRFLAEDGWRDFSPSRIRQMFGAVGWRDDRTAVSASITSGDNRLIGNGAAPVELLESDRSAVFTHPDETKTEIAGLSVNARRIASEHVSYDAVLFFRPATVRTFNGDDTPYEECEEDEEFAGFLCTEDDEDQPVFDQFGGLIPVDDEELDGTNNTSRTSSRGWGGSVQAAITRPLGSRANRLLVGASFDAGRSQYEADTEIARLTDDRGTEGTGLLDAAAAVRLRSNVRHGGLYAADFLSLTPRLTAMGAARLTGSSVELRDRLGTALNGDHGFSRLNAALGATYGVGSDLTVFASYSTASRVPTPSELSCADPEDPCRLPNAFVADPPLEQVVAGTWEGGVRGGARELSWTAAAFHTVNHDDIVFISSGALTNEGHFSNVGDTRRQGVELTAAGTYGARVVWSAAYSYLRAQFRTPLVLSSPNHPDAVDGEIAIEPGASIPNVPRHNLKVGASVAAAEALVGANLRYTSSQFFRGDEANLLDPIEGAATVDLIARYRLGSRLALVGEVTNLFDAEHASFGLFGDADEVLGDDFEDPRFVSPGAPRAAWIGLELSLR